MGYEGAIHREEDTLLTKPVAEPQQIGLMADSHGNLEATRQAVRILKERDAGVIIHLGDIGDSVRYHDLQEILDLLSEHQVLSVKGNNDYLISLALGDRSGRHKTGCPGIFLKQLPMKRVIGDLCFAHSLPFDYHRAFYDPIDDGTTKQAERLMQEISHRILFCGHSHTPVLFRMQRGRVTREHPLPGMKLLLRKEERYIVVVGALDDGECALYDERNGMYERIKIF
jgi:putative phosphoesterase